MHTLKIPSTLIRAYFDFGIEHTPPKEPTNPEDISKPLSPEESQRNRIAYLENVVRAGSATPGQKVMLESYNKDPTAPEQVHYYRSLKGDNQNLTKGQEAFLSSYESNPRAPQFIHGSKPVTG